MCRKEIDQASVRVYIPADRSHTGEGRWRMMEMDACIAPMVDALNAAGILTAASCCGHGEKPGAIALQDGREIEVWPEGWHESYHERIRVHTKVNEQYEEYIHGKLKAALQEARDGQEGTR